VAGLVDLLQGEVDHSDDQLEEERTRTAQNQINHRGHPKEPRSSEIKISQNQKCLKR
jgi:hypothetical protein